MKLHTRVQASPRLLLTIIFITWKILILCITFLSPGIGYDTSTSLLEVENLPHTSVTAVAPKFDKARFTLVRWDAIYYSQLAHRGHLFEQEWAFGKGLSLPVSYITRFVLAHREQPGLEDYVMTGILLSHITHWFSVLLLWSIARKVVDTKTSHSQYIPFLAAVLQILSPAGIFLSAPFSESLFSCLNMLGFYLYAHASDPTPSWRAVASFTRFVAGLVFGCATMVRSNGVLSGLPFLVEAIRIVYVIVRSQIEHELDPILLLDLFFTLLGGISIAVGLALPQFVAFQEYCGGIKPHRPWCRTIPPSIYTWVQSHYWNVGFLRYWTLSNIPLFLLATPMLYLLIHSGIDGCRTFSKPTSDPARRNLLHFQLALPQLMLAVLAVTNYHVQIITRLSSGYPFWCIWLASNMVNGRNSTLIVRTIVVYGMVQAALYASFLPPA